HDGLSFSYVGILGSHDKDKRVFCQDYAAIYYYIFIKTSHVSNRYSLFKHIWDHACTLVLLEQGQKALADIFAYKAAEIHAVKYRSDLPYGNKVLDTSAHALVIVDLAVQLHFRVSEASECAVYLFYAEYVGEYVKS